MAIVKHKSAKPVMGRPVTVGGDKYVGLRLPSELLAVIDTHAEANGLKRSEAIRHLIEFGIANTATAKAKRAMAKSRSAPQGAKASSKPKREAT
jgi:Ribbon-helix-helix protein, copG family